MHAYLTDSISDDGVYWWSKLS